MTIKDESTRREPQSLTHIWEALKTLYKFMLLNIYVRERINANNDSRISKTIQTENAHLHRLVVEVSLAKENGIQNILLL